jgi:hypothetical protein
MHSVAKSNRGLASSTSPGFPLAVTLYLRARYTSGGSGREHW